MKANETQPYIKQKQMDSVASFHEVWSCPGLLSRVDISDVIQSPSS